MTAALSIDRYKRAYPAGVAGVCGRAKETEQVGEL